MCDERDNADCQAFSALMFQTHPMQVLLNVFADEIHRAHQRCSLEAECDPHRDIRKLVLDAGERLMSLLQGAYSCICLVKGVGLVAFRDPHGIRSARACTSVPQVSSCTPSRHCSPSFGCCSLRSLDTEWSSSEDVV